MSEPKYARKDRKVAIVLAIILGGLGVHKFYLGQLKKGVLYAAFVWTGVPVFLGWYDAFNYFRDNEAFGDSETIMGEIGSLGDSESFKNSRGAMDKSTPGPATATGEEDDSSTPDGAVMAVEGVNGKVTLYDNRLEISREGIGLFHKFQHGLKGDKDIPYESITSVQLRKPSSVTRGYIQFGQSGFSESDDGLLDATSDENTVLFENDSLAEFEELREKIRELKQGDVEESTGTMDDAMEKLRERFAEGEIDEEEYNERKEILQAN